ncbi:MAG: hypothetical protein KAR21_26385 [Spirochaetales bacterium]|nr:hypothetical protein [Spirochaetales bacterium]
MILFMVKYNNHREKGKELWMDRGARRVLEDFEIIPSNTIVIALFIIAFVK